MENQLVIAGIVALLSFGLGSLITRYALRNRDSSAKAESAAEIARLNERASLLSIDLDRERMKAKLDESKIIEVQVQLQHAIEEAARLQERAERVPSLEEQVTSLRSDLQNESNKCSALSEQTSRVPILQSDLQLANKRIEDIANELTSLREALASSSSSLSAEQQATARLDAQVTELQGMRQQLMDSKENLTAEVSRLTTALASEQQQTQEKLALLQNAKDQMSAAFKSLANEILEEKSSRFTEQNRTNISQILQPLNVKIDDFKKKVEEVYVEESKDRVALKTQVVQLMNLSEKVSDDAKNLADALKGSSKTQGNWGELILERVLESSGLRKGHEYELRETYHYEDGTRGQPDVVIQLPEEKHLIIDAKVSLTGYERYSSASDEDDAKNALDAHINSVRTHIKELSEKDYPTLYGLKSLDFVVMFVPLESAFAAAIAADSSLWEYGFRRNVLLVSPSSLLFVLRTVKFLWKQEDQAQHVKEIAKCGEDLYDKLVSFIEDLKGLGKQLQKAQLCHENATKKLSEGRGNIISRADNLKQLGLTPKKALPADLVERALQEPIVIQMQIESPNTEASAQPSSPLPE